MAIAHSNGLRIFYCVDGDGPAVLLHHGFSDSLATWSEQGWVERLASRFRVVRLDARGHGQSSKPHEPRAYAMAERVGDCLAVLDAARIEQAAYVGYSLGGRVGFELAAASPDRITAAVLGGAHPFAQSMTLLRHTVASGLDQWIDALSAAQGGGLPAATRQRMLENDTDALAASVARDRPDRSELLAGWSLPTLLFAGARDPLLADIRRVAGGVESARLHEVPGRDHLDLGLNLKAVLDLVEAFLCNACHPT